jgi:large conductance mechanosensitive channel
MVVSGFKKFIMQGNLIDLAVAVVIGTAFAALVKALVVDFITPIIGIFGNSANFGALSFSVGHSKFFYGNFVNAVITFIITAAAIYFIVVAPILRLQARRAAKTTEAPSTKICPECLSVIPLAARRCSFCTSVLSETSSS